jgi:glucokinase
MAGKLYEGACGAAGELGHIQAMPNGRQCTCGQRGCLEAYAGGQNLAAWARDDLRIAMAAARAAGERHPAVGRKLLDLAGEPEKVTVTAMEKAAHEGDELSRRLLDEAGRLLGIALANLITMLNPSRLLLGGGVLLNSPRMTRAAIAGIDAHATKSSRAAVQIVTPQLGEEAGVVGAALLARASLSAAA